MTTLIFNPDGTLKNFTASKEGLELQPGETTQDSLLPFEEFAARFSLKHQGLACQTVYAHVGDPVVEIDISAPGNTSVSVEINGVAQTVPLDNGHGVITLTTDSPASITLAPGDRRLFCAAGEGSLLVVIQP